jgi:NADH-quinone oxidoreductase subunit E
MNPLLETAMQMILCLLIAAIIGAIIGYLIGRVGKCPESSDTLPRPQQRETPEPSSSFGSEEADATQPHPSGTASIAEPAVQATLHAHTEHFEGERPPLLSAPRNGIPDDLKEISGIGLKIEDLLHELGIFHFDQIARWTKENIKWIEQYLNFKGRVERENWVGQAKILSAGQQHREDHSNPDIQKKV